jgi:acetolactate synthase-1/2/3 large subunit
MNGADQLITSLLAGGVDTVFANPGTSEMHFVAALDSYRDVRGILCLFEGVATGAADGYARVTGTPAATLLHLGPGLGNGWANLHNARRAHVPLINIVGDHATYHARFDAPLQSDIRALAATVSAIVETPTSADGIDAAVARAIAVATGRPGAIATLILPADVSWATRHSLVPGASVTRRAATYDAADLERARRTLREPGTCVFLGGEALSARGLAAAQRLAGAGVRVMSETFPTRQAGGASHFTPERLIYLSEFAQAQLASVTTLILVGGRAPVGFFAYPDVASELLAEGCELIVLADETHDAISVLEELADGFEAAPTLAGDLTIPTGELTSLSLAQAVAGTLPEDAIISDESNTGGIHLYGQLSNAAPHDLLTLTGGSIGFGLPVALGASIGGGGRRVVALESDGSMMYTPQALWSMAREGCDVTVVGLSNRSYGILNLERQRVGAVEGGSTSQRMLDLDNPALRLSDVATGMGVPSVVVRTADELVTALRESYQRPGPSFIEAMLPKGLS